MAIEHTIEKLLERDDCDPLIIQLCVDFDEAQKKNNERLGNDPSVVRTLPTSLCWGEFDASSLKPSELINREFNQLQQLVALEGGIAALHIPDEKGRCVISIAI